MLLSIILEVGTIPDWLPALNSTLLSWGITLLMATLYSLVVPLFKEENF